MGCGGKVIAVFTSGGDAQGMNAAIRAVIRMALAMKCTAYFIKEGYQGMVDGGDNIEKADWRSVSSIIHLGGTVIGSARCMEFKERAGRLKAAKNLVKKGITRLICIGGDGSLTGADQFKKEWSSLLEELLSKGEITPEEKAASKALIIVGIVGSIDNDFCGTDMTIGCDSALHRIMESCDAIQSTAYSHKRTFIMEVMGRHCGFLALLAALASEADYCFIPENPEPKDWSDKLCNKLSATRRAGQRCNIIILSEGAIDLEGKAITGEEIKKLVTEKLKHDTRVTVLGHVQRGGRPSAFDRILGCRQGAEALKTILSLKETDEPVVITFEGNAINKKPLMQQVDITKGAAKALDERHFEKLAELRGESFIHAMTTYTNLMQIKPDVKKTGIKIGIMCVGAPAAGVNATIWSITRNAIKEGDTVMAIYDGFEGLLAGSVTELDWLDVGGWVSKGGTSIGTKRYIPTLCKLPLVANKLQEYGIKGLILIGGFEALNSALRITEYTDKFPAFKIPIAIVPSTISNNVPGTDFSLGSDTALNEISAACDSIRLSALGSKRRVFVIETMGGYCGYLATLSGVSGGADEAFINEEPFSILDMYEAVENMKDKMSEGGVLRGLIMRNEKASEHYTTDFVYHMFAQEGKGYFSCRMNVLGHMQQGGHPSPFDRSLGVKFGYDAYTFLKKSITASTFDHVLIGVCNNETTLTILADIKKITNFELRRPKDNWWLPLKKLLRQLGHCPYKRKS